MRQLLKKYLIVTLSPILFFCCSWAMAGQIPIALNEQGVPSLAPMLATITPGVVNIAVEKVIPAPPRQEDSQNGSNPEQAPPQSSVSAAVGSGVILNADQGLIVTNAHVVKDAKVIVVTLKDGRRFKATLMGKDDGFDIAIIKIAASNLTPLTFGDSDQLKVGDFVAAIGSPFGLTETVTSGVVSALNRVEPQIEGFQSFIQTDAPINPGNSGGALVNLKGEVVGINTAMVSPSFGNIGIGFAIPSNMVKAVVEQLLKYGKIKRGMLGVIAQNITPELANALGLKRDQGVIVTKVMHGSPADKAGIREEDVLETLNKKVIMSAAHLHNTLGLMPPGTPIEITVIRKHKSLSFSIKVGDPEAVLQETALPFIAGLWLQDFNELQEDGRLVTGALVTALDDESAGALAGLQSGDVILAANGQSIKSVKELMEIANQKPKELLVKVARGESDLFLVIQRLPQE